MELHAGSAQCGLITDMEVKQGLESALAKLHVS